MALPTIVLKDTLPGRRTNEPVTFTVDSELQEDLWTATTNTGETLTCQRLRANPVPGKTSFITVATFEGSVELTLTGPATRHVEGITEREPRPSHARAEAP